MEEPNNRLGLDQQQPTKEMSIEAREQNISLSSVKEKQREKFGVERNHPQASLSISSINNEGASILHEVSIDDLGIRMGNNRFKEGYEKVAAEKTWKFAKENLGVTGVEDDEVYSGRIRAMEERDQGVQGMRAKKTKLK